MSRRYSGLQALDAEIVVDFTTNQLIMDYTKNQFGSPFNSNTSVVLDKSEWTALPFRVRFFWAVVSAYFVLLTMVPYFIYVKSAVFLGSMGKLPESWHYSHQEFMRYYWTIVRGTIEVSKSGPLLEDLEFILPMNMWLEYELEGEYQEKIKSIGLVRNFVTYYRFGRFKTTQQDGWKLIFKFTSLPQTGSCLVRYVNQ